MVFDWPPRFCEKCGYQFATDPKANIAPPKRFSRKWGWIFGTFAGLWFLFFLVSLRYTAPAHRDNSSSPNVAPTPRATVQDGDIATVADGLWYCGSTKEALDEMTKWEVRHDREEVARVMLRTRSAALTGGIQVKVLDSGGFMFSERKIRTLTQAKHGDSAFNPRIGIECWTVTEALTR
jgi:hypothetical protein